MTKISSKTVFWAKMVFWEEMKKIWRTIFITIFLNYRVKLIIVIFLSYYRFLENPPKAPGKTLDNFLIDIDVSDVKNEMFLSNDTIVQ